ncbi:MAG TPA: hypothetical protein VFP12_04285 [Allosphingosinicella sp.]|nr:hypothetical protein [Allosphingosinicella sp.]
MKISKLIAAAAAFLGAAVLLAQPAEAQVRRCLITAQSSPAVANYDPFNPTALSINSVAITFTRTNTAGGAHPDTIDMYIKAQTSAANGMQMIPVSVVGSGSATGLNQNIFYDTPGVYPNITVPLGTTPVPGVLRWDFSGNNIASNTFTVTFNLVLPANLDLNASSNINFDIEYGCNGTGGGPQFSERATAPNAFTLSVKVLSALQATYVGANLDFGEVGDKTTADVLLAPSTFSTPPTGNNIRVLSSGPYKVEMTSQNAYRLTFPGGNPATAVQRLSYKALFLGQTVSNAAPTFTAVTCARAGVPAAQADLLPIRATLLEGGDGKQLSPDYKDVITVTVSPLAVGPVGVDCPAVVLPSP